MSHGTLINLPTNTNLRLKQQHRDSAYAIGRSPINLASWTPHFTSSPLDLPQRISFGEPTSPEPPRAPQLLHKLWDLTLGNVKAIPYVELRVASPLPPPPLEDADRYPPLPGTSFPGLYTTGSSLV
ncbi:hypothetical protein F5876DRAFT_77788 [Lentinula aff. lateritia]|uniref:Uncharacterized protein n=1 Tax=Lentinula aff. lateritia TaxID=2804960 RepID=A0ACC1TYI9_9AGAR|nr:hypothetical protein F5876DRAFT_77788 [Lentinula aff. lateritia]